MLCFNHLVLSALFVAGVVAVNAFLFATINPTNGAHLFLISDIFCTTCFLSLGAAGVCTITSRLIAAWVMSFETLSQYYVAEKMLDKKISVTTMYAFDKATKTEAIKTEPEKTEAAKTDAAKTEEAKTEEPTNEAANTANTESNADSTSSKADKGDSEDCHSSCSTPFGIRPSCR